jgi:hypothetical protein
MYVPYSMGIFHARRVYFRFDPSIGEVELQVYVEPFTLAIGGLEILKVEGITSDFKSKQKAKYAVKQAEKAKREAKGEIAQKAGAYTRTLQSLT